MIEKNLRLVTEQCRKAAALSGRGEKGFTLICVSKTWTGEEIKPALEAGQRVFGENRVQEAQGKWPDLKAEYENVELHLIGPLQSNKAADAVALFDAIHTVDREKIASAIAKEQQKQNRNVKLFIQVNTGVEPQKAGIEPAKVKEFLAICVDKYQLSIAGLMCIPPVNENPGPHFSLLRKIADELGLGELSMGMSLDYETALELGATHVRVGSAIFGNRDYS